MENQPEFGSLYELLEYVIKHTAGGKVLMETIPIQPSCPSCGWTLADMAKQARLGCGGCYEHFKRELMPVLMHAHKAIRHTGKHPKHKVPVVVSLEELQGRLVCAVREERYEDASEIKKLIQNYKN